jgi:hypothetical protein
MNLFGYSIPPAMLGAAALWIFAAAIRTMPEPKPLGNQFYLWAYSFLHLVGANFDKLKQ